MVSNQKSDDLLENNTPVVIEDHGEVVLNESPLEEGPNLVTKCDEVPEISFAASIGSLPSTGHAFPQSKSSHSRSRSMDLQAKKLNPKKSTYSRHLSGTLHKGDNVI